MNWLTVLVTFLPVLLSTALAIYLLVLMTRFVRAHERIAAALDDMARRPPAARSSAE